MGYSGNIARLPMAQAGLNTDDPQTKVPSNALIRAINVQYYNSVIEKTAGSIRFNQSALPGGVSAIYDWWPDDITQRLISACSNGKIYRHTLGALPATEVTPSDSSPSALTIDNQTVMVSGGAEVTNSPRKLFIFSQSIPQVISGDGITRHAMSKPALDWTSNNQPFFGIIHRSRLFAFGNKNNPHTAYVSSATDHEDFQSLSATFIPCYSGDGERLIFAMVYKGALFVMKYPYGLYQLIDTDSSAANWYFTKINDELGACSPHAGAAIINDVLIGNTNGSISSATAVLSFGNLRTGELFYILRNENFMREEIQQKSLANRHSIFYGDRKMFMTTYQSAGGIKNDRIAYIDMNDPNTFKVSWGSKDQANCLSLRKDNLGVKRPMYGSDDGYIYLMDRADRQVAGVEYTMEAQTPHLDLGFINPTFADQIKLFEFLELDFEATGDFSLDVDILIDGKYMKTITYNLSGFSNLDSFILDQHVLDPETSSEKRKPINLSGRRISLYAKCGTGNCSIEAFNIYFKLSAQQQLSQGKQ